ncbi:hypothetical protein HMN09_01181400 [Mycena chlorophos]|uniref:Uncharacterized protein n=1 Tax=Mycena chlorophos TaxID=658473 RepID=A0A8H6S6M5_MYCCL|nr:hypothetical protein HMN09_01181400 [Mycena chlorophos]
MSGKSSSPDLPPHSLPGSDDDDDDDDDEGEGDTAGYRPPADDDDDEDEDEEEEEFSNEEIQPKPKKKRKTVISRRGDIEGLRIMSAQSGSRAAAAGKRKAVDELPKTKKKAKPAKKAGLTTAAKGNRSRAASSASSGVGMVGVDDDDDDDEAISKYGGPALDNDEFEHVEMPAKRKKGLPKSDNLSVTAAQNLNKSAKAQRGGRAKWDPDLDLPHGSQHLFKTAVTPLVRERAGALLPWVTPNVEHVQRVVDDVYGTKKFTVAVNGAWYGLAGYRVSSWRNNFVSAAHTTIEALFFPPDDAGESEGSESELDDDAPPPNPPAPGSSAASENPPADSNESEDPAPEPFDFETREGRAAFVEWALQTHKNGQGKETGSMAFQWRVWGNGEKKQGFMLSYPILRTFSTHLAEVLSIPKQFDISEEPPIGALVMAAQAVHRELGFWTTGDYVAPSRDRKYTFSADNWADKTTMENGARKTIKRSSKYVKALEKWDKDKWDELTRRTARILKRLRRRNKKAAPAAVSEPQTPEGSDDDIEITSD